MAFKSFTDKQKDWLTKNLTKFKTKKALCDEFNKVFSVSVKYQKFNGLLKDAEIKTEKDIGKEVDYDKVRLRNVVKEFIEKGFNCPELFDLVYISNVGMRGKNLAKLNFAGFKDLFTECNKEYKALLLTDVEKKEFRKATIQHLKTHLKRLEKLLVGIDNGYQYDQVVTEVQKGIDFPRGTEQEEKDRIFLVLSENEIDLDNFISTKTKDVNILGLKLVDMINKIYATLASITGVKSTELKKVDSDGDLDSGNYKGGYEYIEDENGNVIPVEYDGLNIAAPLNMRK